MLTAFTLNGGRLEQTRADTAADLTDAVIWIDMVDPTPEEVSWVETTYQFELPEKAEMKDIEASARFYEDEDGIHVHSFFLNDFEEKATNITVAFSLYGGRLFTMHEEDLTAFRLYRLRARRTAFSKITDVMDLLIGLHETAVEHVADILEEIYSNLEVVSQDVLAEKTGNMQSMLSEIAEQEDRNGKARLSLMDTRRSLSFLMRGRLLTSEQSEDVREILRDLESLTSHTSFLFDKVNFLMNAAMGFINLEQNKTIKIFSIAAVVFLPPTVIASIYGMNFDVMPELGWKYGYAFALGLMVLAGVAPYLFFKRKGWL